LLSLVNQVQKLVDEAGVSLASAPEEDKHILRLQDLPSPGPPKIEKILRARFAAACPECAEDSTEYRYITGLGPLFYHVWNQLARFGKSRYGERHLLQGINFGVELQIWRALQANMKLHGKILSLVEVDRLAHLAGLMMTSPTKPVFAYHFSQTLDLWKDDRVGLSRANEALCVVKATEKAAGSIVRGIANIHKDMLFLELAQEKRREEAHHDSSEPERVDADAEDNILDPSSLDKAIEEDWELEDMDPFIREMMSDQAASEEPEEPLTNTSLEPTHDADSAPAILPEVISTLQSGAHPSEAVTTITMFEETKTSAIDIEHEHSSPDTDPGNLPSISAHGIKRRKRRQRKRERAERECEVAEQS
jgi:hypothetical protein